MILAWVFVLMMVFCFFLTVVLGYSIARGLRDDEFENMVEAVLALAAVALVCTGCLLFGFLAMKELVP